ncbi:MAG: a-factor receptor [Phylliscum demangeonii]|nr:MAG: a-factor receptor [Phylliscum demangeonii]
MESVTHFHRSPGAILLPILATLSIVLAMPPFAWHLKNRNVAACSLIFWVTLANFFAFVNSLIWPTDDVEHWWSGVGLCDVEVKLTWAFSIGASGSLACIMRNLARAIDIDRHAVLHSKAQRRRQALVDAGWCFACPVFVMAIDYLVQSNRFYIFTISGCTPAIDNSWPPVFLVFLWAPLFCLVGSCYCVLVLIRLHKYRRQFAAILVSSHSNLNKNRFLRLFWMALILLLVLLPLQVYILCVNLSYPRHAFSWSTLHGPHWGDIVKVPTGGRVAFDRWIRVSCGFLLFLFFGLGHEAMQMYRKWLTHALPARAVAGSGAN